MRPFKKIITITTDYHNMGTRRTEFKLGKMRNREQQKMTDLPFPPSGDLSKSRWVKGMRQRKGNCLPPFFRYCKWLQLFSAFAILGNIHRTVNRVPHMQQGYPAFSFVLQLFALLQKSFLIIEGPSRMLWDMAWEAQQEKKELPEIRNPSCTN